MKKRYFLLLPISLVHFQVIAQQNGGYLNCASEAMMQSNPVLLSNQQQLDQMALEKSKAGSTGKTAALPLVLPLVVHVIHQNGAENISDAQVFAAVEHLNQAFAHEGYYAEQGDGANTQIQFCLARRTPDGQYTNGITRTESPLTNMVMETDDLPMKDLSRWEPTQYVNIWVVNSIGSQSLGAGVAGYAYLAAAHGLPFDGLVCEAQFFGVDAAKDAVFIHEIGHYLNLYHTFQGGCPNDDCQASGDRVCDTPPDQATHTNCVFNSCSTDADDASANNPFNADANDATANFMDYSPFSCYHNFTDGQGERMRFAIENFRSSLLTSEGCKDPCTMPIAAAFSPSATDVDAGESVVFTNQTTGATSFEWYVNGNLTATTTDFSNQFTSTGIFQITLKAYNADPNCHGTEAASILVRCNVAASFTTNATELEVGESLVCTNTSTGATGYQWFVNGVDFGTTADLSYAFGNAGTYTVVLQATSSYCSDDFSMLVEVLSDTSCRDSVRISKLSFTNNASFQTYFQAHSYHPDGGIYAVVYTPPTGLVARFDADGNNLWQETVGVAYNGVEDISVLNDGSVVFANDQDHRVFKLNPNGTLAWAYSFDLPQYAPEWRGISLGDGALFYTSNGNRLFLVKFESDGTLAWSRLYDFPETVNIVGANNAAGEGGFWLSGGLSASVYTQPDVGLVMKFDNAGNMLLSKKYRTPDNHDIVFLATDFTQDGGFVVSGTYDYVQGVGQNYLAMRGNADGEVVWASRHTLPVSTGLIHSHNIKAKQGGGFWQLTKLAFNEAKWVSWSDNGKIQYAEKLNSSGYMDDLVKHNGKLTGMVKATIDAKEVTLYELGSAGLPTSCADVTHTFLESTYMDMVVEDYPFTLVNATLPMTPVTINVIPHANPLKLNALCAAPYCPEVCDSGLDEDEDGYVDCFDDDCECFDGDGCTADSLFATAPISGKVEWQSPMDWPGINNVPLVANLDPQNGEIPEIIVGEGVPNHSSEVVRKLLIFQGDGSNAANPDVLDIPEMMMDRNTVPAIGDVNSDGIPELAIFTTDNLVRVYSSFSAGNSQAMTLFAVADSIAASAMSHLGMADFDEDGIPEIYAGNYIFQFDFSNPAAPALKRKLVGNMHVGYSSAAGTIASVVADLLSVTDCNGDPDCDGLELVAGANIYSVDLDIFDGDGLEIKVVRNLNNIVSNGNYQDGFTSIADINLDGILDIVTAGQFGAVPKNGCYVWNKNGLIHEFHFPGSQPFDFLQYPTIAIANVFDDRSVGFQQDFPEIIYPANTKITSFSLQAAQTNPASPFWWSVNNQDQAGAAGPSCFDFNGDGFAEILLRNEQYLRLIYGGPLPLPPGVDADRNWTKIECNSQTIDEYPVVADVDADGAAEIVTTGYLSPFVSGQTDYRGRLWVVESDGLPWPPARAVWNQFNYFGVNVNDDLTIPKQVQDHHLELPNLGSGKRPINYFRAQHPVFNENFEPDFPLPDAAVAVDSLACEGDCTRLWLTLCNNGSAALPDSLQLAFYQNDPRQTGAFLVGNLLVAAPDSMGSCLSFSVEIPAILSTPIFVVANDDGSQALPFSTADFPVTNVAECDFENNFASFTHLHQNTLLDLGPDRSLCSSSVTELNAGAGFSSYRWQDGSADSTFTAYGAGTYWVDVWDACGNQQNDTIVIALELAAAVELGADQTICEGDSVTLSTSGFASVNWFPAVGLSCDDCPTTIATPADTVTYFVTAANGDCFVSDSVRIFTLKKPSLVLTSQDGDCANIAQITATASGSPMLHFLWSTGETGQAINPTQSGVYVVTITNEFGCEAQDSAVVEITNSLLLSVQATPINCAGSPGMASVVASGGSIPYSYLWSTGDSTQSIQVTTPGTVAVTVTDAGGCISTASTTVGVVGQLSLGIVVSPITCHGSADGSAAVLPINGTAPFAWLWQGGQTDSMLAGLAGGSYAVTVTDAIGCTDELSFAITEPSALVLYIGGNPVTCFGETNGEATVTASGGTPGYQYFWSNFQTTATAIQLPPGWHRVTVTDENGCADTTGLLLTEPPLLLVSAQAESPTVCPGETTSVAAIAAGGTPPFSFLWNTGQTDSLLTSIAAGIYSVVVTDANDCTGMASVLVQTQQLGVLVLDSMVAASGPTAADGSIFVEFTGGALPFTFLWSNGATSQNLESVPPGDYSLTITDDTGCEQVFQFTVDFLNAASQKLEVSWYANIYPNPAASGEGAQLAVYANAAQVIDCQMFDVTGRLLRWERFDVPSGGIVRPITAPDMAGLYLVVLSNEQGVACLKWVVLGIIGD